jgi:hypothetical protein
MVSGFDGGDFLVALQLIFAPGVCIVESILTVAAESCDCSNQRRNRESVI